MQHSHEADRLSAEDAIFFYLDTSDMPLHMAAVMVFDGPLPMQGCIDLIGSRLPLVPRYRQRIVVPPFNIGHPTWEWDSDFDIRNHIRSVPLKRGTDAELQELTGTILSEVMDRCKPLWDMTLVNGLKGGRGAMIARLHHCLVDGVGGVGLLYMLLGSAPPPPSSGQPFEAAPLPKPRTSLLDGILSSYSEMFERLISMNSAALNVAEAVVKQGVPALDQLFTFVPELLGSVDRLPFNRPCLDVENSSGRKFQSPR